MSPAQESTVDEMSRQQPLPIMSCYGCMGQARLLMDGMRQLNSWIAGDSDPDSPSVAKKDCWA